MLDHKPFTQEEYDAAVGALAEENARLRAALLRIGQPGKSICYCRDGHEESVLIARAALRTIEDRTDVHGWHRPRAPRLPKQRRRS